MRRLPTVLSAVLTGFAGLGLLSSVALTGATPAAAISVKQTICYRLHFSTGWSHWGCNYDQAGTTSTRTADLAQFYFVNMPSGTELCGAAYGQNYRSYGWISCPHAGQVGQVGHKGKRLEKVVLDFTNGPALCGTAYLQGKGWVVGHETSYGEVQLGTEHQSRRLEALRVTLGAACY